MENAKRDLLSRKSGIRYGKAMVVAQIVADYTLFDTL